MEEVKKEAAEPRKLNFLEEIIEADLKSGKVDSILTRFPPEPNGYLHLGHAKSICLNFGLAQKYGGKTNLRFDDTNPTKEDTEYVDSIKEDIQWLGFQWDKEKYASDYFDQLYEWAEKMIREGLAYVDDQTQEEISAGRGTVDKPGTESPYRNRSVEENLRIFREMKAGVYPDGAKVLRAKIDMASPNMMFRDPILYRIKHASHHRTGDKWCIYPMYDYTHGQCDSIENITHSICTLEFDVHRPLYDWFIKTLGIYPSHQYEFARLNLTYTLMSKRKLLELVQKGLVSGWDDPRMPTLCGVRRRGYTPQALKMFCEKIGVSKRDQLMDIQLLEWCVRQDLNARSNRYMVVEDPIKVTLTNWEPGKVEWFDCPLNPAEPEGAKRSVPFTGELYISRADFMEDAPKKFFRMTPGKEVRLKNAYIVMCTGCTKDENGNIIEIQAEYDPISKSGMEGANRKVKGTLHWVSADHCHKAKVRVYDRLFEVENPSADERDFRELLNPESLKTIDNCYVENYAAERKPGEYLQFQRIGYFMADLDSTADNLVFNKTVGLKDAWAKQKK